MSAISTPDALIVNLLARSSAFIESTCPRLSAFEQNAILRNLRIEKIERRIDRYAVAQLPGSFGFPAAVMRAADARAVA
jgi:hypothetical protein